MPVPTAPPRATLLVLAVASLALGADHAVAAQAVTSPCFASDVAYSTSALDRLTHDPEGVLAAEDAFWREENAQVFTTMWAENNGLTISRDRWRKAVARFATLTPSEREASPLVTMARPIVEAKEAFVAGAVPHLCAFFPAEVTLDVPVCFTAFIPPRAFAAGGIVINVTSPYWKGNPENVLNALVHELFHVGYSQLRASWHDTPQAPAPIEPLLDALHNEGMATYTAYLARSAFPAPDERDFGLLDDVQAVESLRGEMNHLLATVVTVTAAKLTSLAWKTGVTRRGYYVVGAAMARTIDVELGRRALVETIALGPATFVRRYNSLVGAERAIVVPDDATIVSRGEVASSSRRLVAAGVSAAALALFGVALLLWRRIRGG